MLSQKRKNKVIALAFGTFDVLHPGHLFYLSESRKHGDLLKVVIARDTTVLQLKGRLPIFNEKDRMAIVNSLKSVDEAVLGDAIHHCRIIEKIKPDIICLGYDQDITTQKLSLQLKKMNISIRSIVRIRPFRPRIHKSTLYKTRAINK